MRKPLRGLKYEELVRLGAEILRKSGRGWAGPKKKSK